MYCMQRIFFLNYPKIVKPPLVVKGVDTGHSQSGASIHTT